MSHIVTIKTQIKDAQALAAACKRLGLGQPVHGKARLFTSEAQGLVMQLPGWTYPVVAQLQSGTLLYDNYGGQWGQDAQLHKLLQAYAIEKARIEARKAGHTLTEQALPGGSVKLQIQVGGAA